MEGCSSDLRMDGWGMERGCDVCCVGERRAGWGMEGGWEVCAGDGSWESEGLPMGGWERREGEATAGCERVGEEGKEGLEG